MMKSDFIEGMNVKH